MNRCPPRAPFVPASRNVDATFLQRVRAWHVRCCVYNYNKGNQSDSYFSFLVVFSFFCHFNLTVVDGLRRTRLGYESDWTIGRAIDGQLKDVEPVVAARDVVDLFRFDTRSDIDVGIEHPFLVT